MASALFAGLIKVLIIWLVAYVIVRIVEGIGSAPTWIRTVVYAVAGIATLFVLFELLMGMGGLF